MRHLKPISLVLAFVLIAFSLSRYSAFFERFLSLQQPETSLKKPEIMLTPDLLGQGARAPTAEELAAEKAFDAQRIEQAAAWLKSADIKQRLIGAQQLNAYQYPAAEALLSQALLQDSAVDVRIAAAQSLGRFKHLGEASQQALLTALADKQKEAALAALDTLLTYSTRISFDSQAFPLLVDKLNARLKNGHLDQAVQRGLMLFIADQQPVCNPLLGPCG